MPPQQLSLFEEAPPTPDGKRRQIQLEGVTLDYELRRAKRRTIGLSIGERGLTVAAPRWVSVGEIEAVIQEKARWVRNKLAHWREQQRLAPVVLWRNGGYLPFLGEVLTLKLDAAARSAQRNEQTLFLPLPLEATAEQIRDRAQAWCQQQARELFAQRLPVYCERLQVSVGRWGLSSARTRWGSCAADGSIRLNWRLVHMPRDVVDYVIAHEVAHRRELNHSKNFWHTVQSLFPEFRHAEVALRQHGLGILRS